MNHHFYADDAVLLAPTPKSLQHLIHICEDYARHHDIVYNIRKSMCSSFLPRKLGKLHIPDVFLYGVALAWVKDYKYLGAVISDNGSDDRDMDRQVRELYVRGNTIARAFSKCSKDVKAHIFTMQCSCLYGAHLWRQFNLAKLKRARTAYNDIFRLLMNIKRGESISAAFLSANVHSFQVLIRRAIFSFISRCFKSCNKIVNSIVSSVFFLYGSKMMERWCKCLIVASG